MRHYWSRMAKKQAQGMPNPEQLLQEAQNEAFPVRKLLEMYWPVVCELREKDFSWRDVSSWLAGRGVNLHYKQLERHAVKLELGVDDDEKE